ncbi:MAG: ATP-binding cassette domain-containing protein [Oscillospiraceae bacterium]|nr:ATP-binding cassette domain-containing protein [Oscillospiraceae bacterium]
MLSVNNLCKSYGSVKALDDVSFNLEKGGTLAVIGPSGGGKSTLLRVLNGLETPDSGSIVFPENPDGKGTFGLVFQDYNLFPQYTVMGNITLAPKLMKKNTKTEIYAQAEEILSKVGLSEKKNNYPSQLSGGQKQRTAIARALMLKPDILCFDEPTSALDPKLTDEIVTMLKELKGEQTIIIVTHDMDVMREVADITATMDDGKLKRVE